MEHHFNVQVAQQFGVEEAIIIHNLFHWISRNAANDENMFEGFYWTYNSIKAYSALFPYMSETKVKRVFKCLEEKGFIIKGNFSDDKWVRTNWYSFPIATLNYLQSVGYCVHWCKTASSIGSKCTNGVGQNDQMILLNDNNINNTYSKQHIVNKEEDTNVSPKKELFEECWKLYGRKGSKKNAIIQWDKLKQEDYDKIKKHIPFYIKSNEFVYLKDFERYLKGRMFESRVVNKEGQTLFDPERENSKAYSPICGANLMWNDFYNTYVYLGYWDGVHIYDGYKDDDRPDGAKIMLNNGQVRLTWSKETKTWNK